MLETSPVGLHSAVPIALITVLVVLFVLTWATLVMRIYVRAKMLMNYGLDDTAVIIAQLLFSAKAIMVGTSIMYGTGRHIHDLSQHNAERALMWWWMSTVFYIIGLVLVKVSIGLFLLRFTSTSTQRFLITSTMVLVGLLGVSYEAFFLSLCRPISFWWDLSPGAEGRCIPAHIFRSLTTAAAVLCVLVDLLFMVVPTWMVWHTTMERRTKVHASIIFALSSLIFIGTVGRLSMLHTFSSWKGDFLFRTWPVVLLSDIEWGLGMIGANAANLSPLYQKYRSWVGTRGADLKVMSSNKSNPYMEQHMQVWDGKGWMNTAQAKGALSVTARNLSVDDMPDLLFVRDIEESQLGQKPNVKINVRYDASKFDGIREDDEEQDTSSLCRWSGPYLVAARRTSSVNPISDKMAKELVNMSIGLLPPPSPSLPPTPHDERLGLIVGDDASLSSKNDSADGLSALSE